MNDAPKTIFKFQPFSLQAVQNLKSHSVYFGSPLLFNDPFDCAISPRLKLSTDVDIGSIAARLASNAKTPQQIRNALNSVSQSQLRQTLIESAKIFIRDQRDDFNKIKGITCFSEHNDNMLMWSHYGGQHRGFCLEFRTEYEPFNKLRPVTYSPDIPEIDIARFMIDANYEDVFDLFCTKSIDWNYEYEWRALHVKAGTLFTYKADALKAIYFGAKMSDQDIDMICLILHGQNPNVELHRGHRSDTEFKIDFTEFFYTPLAKAKQAELT